MCIDIVEICYWIAEGQILSIFSSAVFEENDEVLS